MQVAETTNRRPVLLGLAASAALTVLVIVGSRNLEHYDPALFGYTVASVVAFGALVYRYAVWLGRPATRVYWRRGWQLFRERRRLAKNARSAVATVAHNIVEQRFIARRGCTRWLMHALIMWGCIISALITFPLVFGWVHFELEGDEGYRAYLFGFPVPNVMQGRSLIAWVTFHALDFTAAMVIAGCAIAIRRRLSDRGAIAPQQFMLDFVPHMLLISVSVTGLMLTASSLWLGGYMYYFIALSHQALVIMTLFYLPFGKFFHIVQRPASVGVYSGSSLTTEKTYLMGKFARAGLGTRYVDYNGRLCMVSAAAGNNKAFGIDRAANPWDDIPLSEVLILAGANAAETFPVLNKFLWQQRDNGGVWIVVDPRETPTARQGDIHLQLKPGTDVALCNGMLHVLIQEKLIDENFIAGRTNGWEETRELALRYTPQVASEITGVPAERIVQAARVYGRAKTGMVMHARGIEHHTNGVNNVLSYINLVLATGKIGAPGRGYGTITGQGNGQGGREHGQKADQLPGQRSIMNPEHRKYVCGVWGLPEEELPQAGVSCVEMFTKMREGEIRGLLSICNNVMVSLPDINQVRRSLEGLDFYVCIDFFMSEGARYADVVLPGTTWAEDEGVTANSEGRVVKINKAADPPGEAREDWWIINEMARRMGRGKYFPFNSPREIFDELRVASKGGNADYYGITYEKIERQNGVFWPCPSEDHPGTPRLFEERFNHPDGRAKFHAVEFNPPAEVPDEEYPLILTSGRVVYQYLSGNQTRRIGFLVQQCPEPYVEIHPETAARLKVSDGERVKVVSRRGEGVFPVLVVRTIRPDTIFIPYHWGEQLAANQLTNAALDPTSKIPEYKACAARVEKVHSRELPILGKQRKGAERSSVTRLGDGGR